MNLFESPGADAAYDRWLDPPSRHEVDECSDCHSSGDHDNPLAYYEVCDGCSREISEKAKHTAIEFEFTVDDVETARAWARSHKYRYESVEHLLLDALRSQVIKTDKWTTL